MKKLILLLVVSAVFYGTSEAQLKITLFGLQSDPIFNMRKQGYSSGSGLGVGLYYSICPDQRFSLDLGGSFYGSGNGSRSGDSPIGTYTVDNSFAAAFLEGKVLMNLKNWSPYLELHYGAVSYGTQEYVQGVSDYLIDVTSTNYGAGLGVLYKAANNFYLDFGVGFNSGTNVNFLDLHSFTSRGKVIDYNVNNANSNMLIFKLGIAFTIDLSKIPAYSSGPYYSSTPTPYYYPTPYSNSCYKNTGSNNYSGGYNTGGTIIHHGKTPVGISH